MGIIEQTQEEVTILNEKVDRLLELMRRQQEHFEALRGATWVSIEDLAKIYHLSRDSVRVLVNRGLQAGVVVTRNFTVTGRQAVERIHAESFDVFLSAQPSSPSLQS